MKTILLLILIGVLVAIGVDTAHAAVSVYVNATMPYEVLYQGQVISANVTVKNNENFPIRIYSVGVHYDWMPSNVFSSVDFGGDYVQVESNGVTTPGQLPVQCGANVSVGYHSYFYKVDLNWYNSYTSTWLNETVVQPGTIYVESPLKPQALQELQFANMTLSDARNTTFISKKAVASMQNASDRLSDGWSAYNAADYGRAINDSRDVIACVSDAKVAEKNYRDNASQVETLVVSVADKLKSVSATSDPDTRNALQEANRYLNETRQQIDAEEFTAALGTVHKADQSADNAINLQFYYFLKANETDAAKGRAQAALDKARAGLDNASGMTSASATGILGDARARMEDATLEFGQGDYANATIAANVVSTLVAEAGEDEAGYRMTLARSKIDAAGELRSPGGKALMANASHAYDQSEEAFVASDFNGAIVHANLAIDLAGNASAEEQKWLDANPLNAVTPGFGLLAAVLALAAVFILRERKD